MRVQQLPWLTKVSSLRDSQKGAGESLVHLDPQRGSKARTPAWKHTSSPSASWQCIPNIWWPCPSGVWLTVWEGSAFNPWEVAEMERLDFRRILPGSQKSWLPTQVGMSLALVVPSVVLRAEAHAGGPAATLSSAWPMSILVMQGLPSPACLKGPTTLRALPTPSYPPSSP